MYKLGEFDMKKRIKLRMTVGMMLLVLTLTACGENSDAFHWEGSDAFSIKGEKYVAVELKQDLFFYDASLRENPDGSGWSIVSEDEDGEHMYTAECGIGEPLYYNGTFYCREGVEEEITAYYADDENYNWYVEFDLDDGTVRQLELDIEQKELTALYQLENFEKKKSVFFDEIETMASLIKVSKDQLVEGRTSLLCTDGRWYWRTETIDEGRERDGQWAEYIQPLPETLSEKIKEAIE